MLVVGVHIAVIARWSGKIDGFMSAMGERMVRAESEITRLREARHTQDGLLQRHEGVLKEWDRRGSIERRQTLGEI